MYLKKVMIGWIAKIEKTRIFTGHPVHIFWNLDVYLGSDRLRYSFYVDGLTQNCFIGQTKLLIFPERKVNFEVTD